jgi:tetratricopeptide (TPR) repeat protein
VTISLFSNMFFLIGTVMAERFLFLSSVGFCLVVALIIEKVAGKTATGLAVLKSPKVLGILIPLSIIYAIIIYNRNAEWSDNYTLYTTDVDKAPNDARLHYYAADCLLKSLSAETGRAEGEETVARIMSHLNKAVAIYPAYVNAQSDLGTMYFNLRNFDSSKTYFIRASELDPKYMPAISGLSQLYFVNKLYRECIENNRKAIAFYPDYPMTYSNSGFCYLNLRKFDSAILFANKAISLDPSLAGPYQILAEAYTGTGNLDSARKYDAIARRKGS